MIRNSSPDAAYHNGINPLLCAVQDNAPFILLDDARRDGLAKETRFYSRPVEIITVYDKAGLNDALTRLHMASEQGLYAAGYLHFEAGYLLEERLSPLIKNAKIKHEPLIWFGLFTEYYSAKPAQMLKWLQEAAIAQGRLTSRLGAFHSAIGFDEYAAAFDKVKRHIMAGDIYQLNLTFPMDTDFEGSIFGLYLALRDRAGAGYGGIIHGGAEEGIGKGSGTYLSFSPELFYHVDKDKVMARPMKGTSRRGGEIREDIVLKNTLYADPKQRAENLMIVDLLRNDLSRIAVPGSVKVPKLFHIESFPTVHQMVSTITAQRLAHKDNVHILRALFPSGSIIGAPKIRAMEIIKQLEPHARGIYCGSIGRIDPCGDAAFNVAIRTIALDKAQRRARLNIGSGIVADSTLEAEWRECHAKAEFAQIAR